MQLVCMWFIVNGKWCIRERLHFSCAAGSKQILVRLKPWYDLLAGSLREVIWRFSLGRCWISCHNCHFCRAATVRGSIKNPIASWENDKRSVTRLGDEVFRHQPYKSIEKKIGKLTMLCSLERSCLLFHEGLHLYRLWGCEKEEQNKH